MRWWPAQSIFFIVAICLYGFDNSPRSLHPHPHNYCIYLNSQPNCAEFKKIYIFLINTFVCFFSPPNTDGNRIAANVFGRKRSVAATGHAQLPGWLRPVVQTVALQPRRRRRTVGGEHHSRQRVSFSHPLPPRTASFGIRM